MFVCICIYACSQTTGFSEDWISRLDFSTGNSLVYIWIYIHIPKSEAGVVLGTEVVVVGTGVVVLVAGLGVVVVVRVVAVVGSVPGTDVVVVVVVVGAGVVVVVVGLGVVVIVPEVVVVDSVPGTEVGEVVVGLGVVESEWIRMYVCMYVHMHAWM